VSDGATAYTTLASVMIEAAAATESEVGTAAA
jgi:hypothetical protein